MRSMDCTTALVALGASLILAFGCAQSAPASRSVPGDGATAFSVFTDTTVYRRHCVVPNGRPVDLTQPCLLLDQGLAPVRRPPTLIP